MVKSPTNPRRVKDLDLPYSIGDFMSNHKIALVSVINPGDSKFGQN